MLNILEFLKEYMTLIATFFTAFTGCVAWWLSRNFASKLDLEKLETKVDSLANSEEVKSLSKDIHEMQKSMVVYNEKFKQSEKDSKRLVLMVDRIDSYLRGAK